MANMRTSLLFVLALGCSGDGDKATDTDTAGTHTLPTSVGVSEVVATPAPNMGTVIEVSWTSSEAVAGFVRFAVDGEPVRETAVDEPGTAHVHTLVGVPPGADVEVELVHVLAEEVVSHTETVTAGTLPGAPTLSLEGSSDRYLALALIDVDSTIVIIDPKGRVAWSYVDR